MTRRQWRWGCRLHCSSGFCMVDTMVLSRQSSGPCTQYNALLETSLWKDQALIEAYDELKFGGHHGLFSTVFGTLRRIQGTVRNLSTEGPSTVRNICTEGTTTVRTSVQKGQALLETYLQKDQALLETSVQKDQTLLETSVQKGQKPLHRRTKHC